MNILDIYRKVKTDLQTDKMDDTATAGKYERELGVLETVKNAVTILWPGEVTWPTEKPKSE